MCTRIAAAIISTRDRQRRERRQANRRSVVFRHCGRWLARAGRPTPQATLILHVPAIDVIFPVVRRKFGAEASYAPVVANGMVRELKDIVGEVLFFADDCTGAELAHQIVATTLNSSIVRRPTQYQRLAFPASLRQAFGDSLDKVVWRSRLVLDFFTAASLMQQKSQHRGHVRHLLWMEDDVLPLGGFGETLARWLGAHGDRTDWLVLKMMGFERDPDPGTWSWGTAGWGGGGVMLYNGHHLANYSSFVESNFDAAPLDWLHDRYPVPAGLARWWKPRLRPVLLHHLGEHSTHVNFV